VGSQAEDRRTVASTACNSRQSRGRCSEWVVRTEDGEREYTGGQRKTNAMKMAMVMAMVMGGKIKERN
jgi:hypothetical protein